MVSGFCPLCAKNGVKRRLKAFQISLEDAVWACEAEECAWPISYEELTFFNRAAVSCNWEEEMSPAKEDMPALMELSLYTPPVTPGGELSKELTEIASTEYSSNPSTEDKAETFPQCEYIAAKESSGSNKSSLFESLELGDDSGEESRGITNEQIGDVNIFRTLPKITNIEKTNINLRIFSNAGEHCNNKNIQEHGHSLMDAAVMNTFKNFDLSNGACTEFGLSTQYRIEDKHSESCKLQSNAAGGVETNCGAETLQTMKTLVNVDTNSLNATNDSTENISDIDTLLEDILNDESQIPVNINEDWLNLLIS